MNGLRVVAYCAFTVAVVLIAADVFALFTGRPMNAPLSLAASLCTLLAVILLSADRRRKANR